MSRIEIRSATKREMILIYLAKSRILESGLKVTCRYQADCWHTAGASGAPRPQLSGSICPVSI